MTSQAGTCNMQQPLLGIAGLAVAGVTRPPPDGADTQIVAEPGTGVLSFHSAAAG